MPAGKGQSPNGDSNPGRTATIDLHPSSLPVPSDKEVLASERTIGHRGSPLSITPREELFARQQPGARSEENDQRSITQETAIRSLANVTKAAGHILFVPVTLLIPGQDFSYRLTRTDVPQIVPDHPQAFWPLIVKSLQALQVLPDHTLDEII